MYPRRLGIMALDDPDPYTLDPTLIDTSGGGGSDQLPYQPFVPAGPAIIPQMPDLVATVAPYQPPAGRGGWLWVGLIFAAVLGAGSTNKARTQGWG